MTNAEQEIAALDRMLFCGPGGGRINKNSFEGLQITETQLAAIDTLKKSDLVEVTCALWCTGSSVKEIIDLGSNTFVGPIERPPKSTCDRHQAEHVTSYNELEAVRKPGTSITKVFTHFQQNGSEALNPEDAKEVERKLWEVAVALNTQCTVQPQYYSYSARYLPSGLVFAHLDFDCGRSAGLAVINPDEIRNNFFLTAQSDSSIRRIYFESCRYLARAKSFSRPEDKFLNLGIATEIALLQDDSGHRVDQLSAQFRLRGARLIGNSVEERKKVQDRLRELYNIRSQIAHTGLSSQLTKQTKNSTTDEKNSYFRGHCELTERILRVISINGFPDWEKLLLE